MLNKRECVRLTLNSMPSPQDFKPLGRCVKLNRNSYSFKNCRKDLRSISLYLRKTTFRLIPKIFNAVNLVLAVCKFIRMVDAVMSKTAYVRLVVIAQTASINITSSRVWLE